MMGGFVMQWHQLDHMQTICTSLQTANHTNTSSLNFYAPAVGGIKQYRDPSVCLSRGAAA